MLSRHWKYLSFPLLFLLFVFLGEFQTVQACSCMPTPTVLDAYDRADVVVVVRAVSVEKATPEKTAPEGRMSDGENYVNGVMSTTTQVEQVFKGKFTAGDEMIFDQGGGANCIWTFDEGDVGKKFLFYLRRFEGGTRWVAGTCGRSRNLEHAADDLLYLNNLDKALGRTRISGTLSFTSNTVETVARRKIQIVGAGHTYEGQTYEVTTDDNGVYEIYDVPAGRYLLQPEIPRGWTVAPNWEEFSRSRSTDKQEFSKEIFINVIARKHTCRDIRFDIDNAIRGHIYDPAGRLMKGVCLDLVPADGSKGPYLADCTEAEGAFEVHRIPPGDYVILVNEDNKVTSSNPFGAFYYPNVAKREDATVFHIGLGDFVEDLKIYPTFSAETITVEGSFLYSDGKPVVSEWVSFRSVKAAKAARGDNEGEEEDDDYDDARAETDAKGRFSIKILKGARGWLAGGMYTYVGEFENCPKLDRVIKQSGEDSPELKTPAVEILAEGNLYGVVLKYPFPGCKKAKTTSFWCEFLNRQGARYAKKDGAD